MSAEQLSAGVTSLHELLVEYAQLKRRPGNNISLKEQNIQFSVGVIAGGQMRVRFEYRPSPDIVSDTAWDQRDGETIDEFFERVFTSLELNIENLKA